MDVQTPGAPTPAPRGLGALVAPHARLGHRGLLALTVFQALAGLVLARAGVRFDGVLDVHRTWRGEPVPLALALLDQIAALPVAAAAALLTLRLAGQRARFGDVVLALGTARVPLVLLGPVVLAMPAPTTLLAPPAAVLVAPPPAVVVGALVAVLGSAWSVALLAAGVRGATGARGWRLVGLAAGAALAAEVAAKLLLAAAG